MKGWTLQYRAQRWCAKNASPDASGDTIRAFKAGYLACYVNEVKRNPSATLLHVLDTQQHLKDKIASLRAALQSLSHQALVEAGK